MTAPQTHTSTQEWQSFAGRMRRRRAERLLLRASAALDAEYLEEAEAALSEARALEPAHPALQEVTDRLLAASDQGAGVSRRGWTAAWLLVLLGAGLWGGWSLVAMP